MSSERQIEANRRNSQSSTGPRTPEGKSVSRFNALKSGINSKALVIPGEDPAELEAMKEGYHRDWVPSTYLERFLVDALVRADWLLQRLSRLEAELWELGTREARASVFSKLDVNAPLGDVYNRTYDRFHRLQRRIDSTERSYYRALKELQRLRAGQLETSAPLADPLSSDPCPPAPNAGPPAPVPPGPAQIGFVLPQSSDRSVSPRPSKIFLASGAKNRLPLASYPQTSVPNSV